MKEGGQELMGLRIIYYVAISVDGFISRADGRIDWLDPFQASGEDYEYAAFFENVDGLVMGRRTYEQILGFAVWPYANKPSWVLSSKGLATSQPGIAATPGPPADLARRLAAQRHQRIWLVGGATTAASFERERLITDYILTVIPVFLGQGLSLFDSAVNPGRLTLAGTRTFSNGVIQLHYTRP